MTGRPALPRRIRVQVVDGALFLRHLGQAAAAARGPRPGPPPTRRGPRPIRGPAQVHTRELAERLGRELRRVREARGDSQSTLAQRVGVSRSLLGQVERGARLPGLRLLLLIARGLRLTISFGIGSRSRIPEITVPSLCSE